MINALFVFVFMALFVVVQLCANRKFGIWFNPITFFCSLWAVTAAISNLGLYGYFTPSIEVNFIMLAGILTAFIVCMGVDFGGGSFKQDITGDLVRPRPIKHWVCAVLCLVGIGMLLLKLPQAISITASQGWAYLRTAYYANPLNYDGPQ